jgi:hypothetical protein
MTWIVKFSLICLGAIFAITAAVWALGNVTEGLSTHGIVALAIGSVFTVGLAVGLMALTFVRGHGSGDDHGESLPKQG